MLGGACVGAAAESVEVLPGVSLRSELVPEMRAWQCFAPFIDVTRLGFLADYELDDTVVFDIEQGEGQPSLLCRLKVEDLRTLAYGQYPTEADIKLCKRYFDAEYIGDIPEQWDAAVGVLYGANTFNVPSKTGRVRRAFLTRMTPETYRHISMWYPANKKPDFSRATRVVTQPNLKPWVFVACYAGGNISHDMLEHLVIREVRVNPDTGDYVGERCVTYNYRTLECVSDYLTFFHPEQSLAPEQHIARNAAALQALLKEPELISASVFLWQAEEWRGTELPVAEEDLPRLREIIRHMQANPEYVITSKEVIPSKRCLWLCLKNRRGEVLLRLHPDRIKTPSPEPADKSNNWEATQFINQTNCPFSLPTQALHREFIDIVNRTLPAKN